MRTFDAISPSATCITPASTMKALQWGGSFHLISSVLSLYFSIGGGGEEVPKLCLIFGSGSLHLLPSLHQLLSAAGGKSLSDNDLARH